MNVNNPPKVKIVDPSPIIPRELTPPVLGIDLSSSLLFFSEDSTLTGISFLSDVSGFSSGVSGFTSGVSGFTSCFTSGTSGSFVDLYNLLIQLLLLHYSLEPLFLYNFHLMFY